MRADAEKSQFLCERLGIIMLPTIVLVKDGRTDHSIIGFDEFGGSDDFSTDQMRELLTMHEMLHPTE